MAVVVQTATAHEHQNLNGQVAMYGERHAHEHFEASRAALATPLADKSRDRATSNMSAQATADTSSTVAAEVGVWEPPKPVRGHPIHAVLLRTGKVLYFSYPLYTGTTAPLQGDAWVWDPVTEVHTAVPPPPDVRGNEGRPAQIFCSGQSVLPDGRVLVAGGTLSWESAPLYYKGHYFTHIFDPETLKWERGPEMRRGRWYPSQLALDDNTTLIVSGYADDGAHLNDDLEVFDPMGGGNIGKVGTLTAELYPHLTQLPDRRIAVTGPGNGTDGPFRDDSALIDPQSWSIADVPPMSRTRIGSTRVHWPAGPGETGYRVSIFGGLGGSPLATGTQDTIDFADASPAFEERMAFNIPRSYHNTSWLPDGSLATVGGGAGKPEGSLYDVEVDAPQHEVELYDPVTKSWRTGAAQQHDRAYHSVALLLPDGRVWSSGDDDPRDGRDHETYETYEPPYLHKGPRPAIAWSPDKLGWGQRFAVLADSHDAPITRAALISPSAVTHAVDMGGRYVPLTATPDPSRPGRLILEAPGSRTLAPEGHYMLFVLTNDGVPSIARWVHLTGVSQPTPAEPVEDADLAPGADAATPQTEPSIQQPFADPSPPITPLARVKRRLSRKQAVQALRRGWLYITQRPWAHTLIEVRIDGRLAARRTVTRPGRIRVRLKRSVRARASKRPKIVVNLERLA